MRGSVGGSACRRQWRRGRVGYQLACGWRKLARSCGVCHLPIFSCILPVGVVRWNFGPGISEFLRKSPEGIFKTTGGHYEDSAVYFVYSGVVDRVKDNFGFDTECPSRFTDGFPEFHARSSREGQRRGQSPEPHVVQSIPTWRRGSSFRQLPAGVNGAGGPIASQSFPLGHLFEDSGPAWPDTRPRRTCAKPSSWPNWCNGTRTAST